jgi:transposase
MEPGSMIQITAHMRILLAVEAVDFRKGIDGLAGVCRQVLDSDPFSGYLFIFRNRRGTAIKILVYDGQGFWLCQKRLSQGRFSGWPQKAATAVEVLAAHELQLLLWNGQPRLARVAPPWKGLATGSRLSSGRPA